MRSYLVCVLLVGGLGTFGYIWSERTPQVHILGIKKAAANTIEKAAQESAKQRTKPRKRAKPKTPPKPPMKRPLRVVALGWETLAPGLMANGGRSPGKTSVFAKQLLQVHMRGVKRRRQVAQALARGGQDSKGADIALLSLPDFVASYERLQALQPQVFYVVGWSAGREGLYTKRDNALRKLWQRRRVKLVARQGTPAAFLGYFALSLAGVPPRRVKTLRPSHPQAKRARFIAMASGDRMAYQVKRRHLLLSSADTAKLIPIVAVAPKSFLRANPQAIETWLKGWHKGVAIMNADIPAAARRIALMARTPDTLSLLKRMGHIKAATLRENTALLGLSGRSPLTLQSLLAKTWRIWRGAGVVRATTPSTPPISHDPVLGLSQRAPKMLADTGPESRPQATAGAKVLLSHYAPSGRYKAHEWSHHVATIAAIFQRLPLHISVLNQRRPSQALLAQLQSQYAISSPERILYRRVNFQRKRRAVLQILRQP